MHHIILLLIVNTKKGNIFNGKCIEGSGRPRFERKKEGGVGIVCVGIVFVDPVGSVNFGGKTIAWLH